MKSVILLTLSLFIFGACANYKYAHQIKNVSFDDDVTKGKAIGPIRGEDCTWTVLTIKMGGDPTIEKAFINARTQASGYVAAGLSSNDKNDNLNNIRYINNVSTMNEGFDAVLFRKTCLVVKGIGYK